MRKTSGTKNASAARAGDRIAKPGKLQRSALQLLNQPLHFRRSG
jgi:hypothetical protein